MIAITAASGKLGHQAVEALLKRVPAARLVALVRHPARAADLAALGLQVRQGDYDRPATLGTALAGVEKLLFISGSEVGRRVPQHQAVVDAARRAGVRLVAYTSILHADTSGVMLAVEHRETEAMLRASGVPHVLLRNGWYLENYTEHLGPALAHGAIAGSARDGRIAGAARADYAEAAAAVLTGEGHEGRAYELAGTPFTMADLAAEVSRQAGKPVAYRDLPPADYRAVLVGAGIPGPYADALVDADLGVARGELDDASGDLERLIGRPSTRLATAVATALAALGARPGA
ncbi:NmrA family protein [Anaeromyxobacter sp. K]|uniref:SDR family oxidoreductase n=1 Tax=Anaeromyxobacter sp. (strain K) TaxID=447217 RepID=UPI00015F8D78|nr:SDR family oxidoreductase [Anaeromyxobacter sp. K]ACG74416.1 NmrA family protein [Anaeromyxobacter sp. K]